MDIARCYVAVDSSGKWLSRPFGSVEAADKASERIQEVCVIIEVTMAYVSFNQAGAISI